jgi:ArsR family transcriptional regulator
LHEEVIQLHANMCSALADASRIMLLYALSANSMCVKDLAAELGLSQPTTSRHLKILRESGLVSTVRQGPSVEYSLTDRRLIEALDLDGGSQEPHHVSCRADRIRTGWDHFR